MLQRHITTTTSFIVSSDESLNKPPSLSSAASACGRSTDSSENMSTTTTASVSDSHADQSYFSQSSTDSIPSNNINNNIINRSNIINSNHRQQSGLQLTNGRFAMLPPQPIVPPPPPPPPPLPPSIQDKCYESFDSSAQSRPVSMFNREKQFSPEVDGHLIGPQVIYGAQTVNEANHRLSLNFDDQSLQTPLTLYKQQQNNNNLVQSFQNTKKHSPKHILQRSPNNSLESSSPPSLMPMNVKGMLLHGLSGEEVMRNWLLGLKCDDLIKNFVDHGYDIYLVTRMTPQDLAAIGCKSPALRKKLLLEIRKMNLDYELPEYKPMILEQWLDTLKLKNYYTLLISEGYDSVDKVCQLTWEDLEEIGINKLGHQKRLLLGIEKVKKSLKIQEDRQNDSAIYDVHPNHRISLNGSNTSTICRVRSGFFQTRSGANLDHRGLPVATVMPAFKHISSPIINDETQLTSSDDMQKNQIEAVKMSNLVTAKRNLPPLPPLRTNSLKFVQPDGQPLHNNHQDFSDGTSSGTSFSSRASRSSLPIREAPLPPHLQNRLSVPERIDEEPSNSTHISSPTIVQNDLAVDQVLSADEFPPPPP